MGRVRSESLSLPSNDLSSAFGSSLFAAPWQPSETSQPVNSHAYHPSNNFVTPSSPNGIPSGRLAKAAFESIPMPLSGGALSPDESQIVRALDYLGLDDQDGSVANVNAINNASATQYRHGQTLSPNLHPHENSFIPTAGLNRARSFTVAVGDLSLNGSNASSNRPRSSSMGVSMGYFVDEAEDGHSQGHIYYDHQMISQQSQLSSPLQLGVDHHLDYQVLIEIYLY
jgi:hypothetical protein